MKKIFIPTRAAFSIIEVMIGIFVFSLWLVAVFALLSTSLSANDLNKNSIIAWQLAREQIELVRNIRDTNYKSLKLWNQLDPKETLALSDKTNNSKVFIPWNYYFIENDISSWNITVQHLWSSIPEWKSDLVSMRWTYGLCFDSSNRYVKCNAWNTSESIFYKFLLVENAQDDVWNDIDDAYIFTSKVIWYKRWYHDFEINTILTDWRRI